MQADGRPQRRRRKRRPRAASGSPAPTAAASNHAPAQEAPRPQKRRRNRRKRSGGGGPPAPQSATQKALLSGGYKLPALNELDQVSSDDWPPAFSALNLSDRMLSALTALKFEEPTPIQEQSIPMLMNGHDVVGQAQTGTGKTVAFGLPAVEVCDPDLGECQAIVLTPTRELAQQVGSVLDFFARAAGLEATVLMGGRRLSDDFANLERRPQIVVGTPGRIIDHLERRTLRLNRVRMAVLDEADRMLDIGFYPDMRRILRRCPDDRQTALFSATIPTPIKSLIHQFMHDPEHVHIAPEIATAEGIYQRYYEVADRDKIRAVEELLPELSGRTLVFCNMKVTVDRLVRRLLDRGLNADAIHGDRDQRKRDRVMGRFRSGDLQFLIATDVAARGLDIPDVQHVVNFDLPQTAEDYVHRVGRTGRAGAEGSAISFVGEWDFDQLEKILKLVGDDLQRGELELYSSG
ncbi:MAG: DEAD/DEAH box helicase [Chloroflexi bacterium]|nr:DEAD/DEAH box helicase [Chloroflexota bacterium]MCY3588044.1 DEAD/DEAH box helicase [Chloroflexota bacterium]MCY3684656.1 DEAD/DEAH box helicase [Chloroflexota bacterium]MDE2708095.1 DEAD/DEAH box helicase [Chloroflexota bacterium]